MSTLTFEDSPVGRAAKNALEHLLADHRNNEFTYADFPPAPQEFLDFMAAELKEASRHPAWQWRMRKTSSYGQTVR